MTSAVTEPRRKGTVGRGALYTVATALRMAAGVALLPLVTRAMRPVEYASIALLSPLWWLMQGILSLGISEGITKAAIVHRRTPQRQLLAGSVCVIPMTVLFLCMLLSLGPSWLGVRSSRELVLVAFISGAMSFAAILAALARARDQVGIALLATIAPGVLAPAVATVSVKLGNPTAEQYFLYMAATCVVGCVLPFAALFKGAGDTLEPAMVGVRSGSRTRRMKSFRDPLRTAIRVGLPTVPSVIGLVALELCARRRVLEVRDASVAAGFSIGLSIGLLAWVAVKAITLAWAPHVFESAARTNLTSPTKRLAWLAIIGQAGLCIGANTAMALLMPSSYRSHELTLVVICASVAGPVGVVYVAHQLHLMHMQKSMIFGLSTIGSVGLCSGLLWLPGLKSLSLIAACVPMAMLISTIAMRTASSSLRADLNLLPLAWPLMCALALAAISFKFGSGGTVVIATSCACIGVAFWQIHPQPIHVSLPRRLRA
jgi:hypothetical protein